MKKILAICSIIGLAILLISCGSQKSLSKIKDGSYNSGDVKGEFTTKDFGGSKNSGDVKTISVDMSKSTGTGTDVILTVNYKLKDDSIESYTIYNGKINEKDKTIDFESQSGKEKGKVEYRVKNDGEVVLKGDSSLPWAKSLNKVTVKPKDEDTKEKYK